MSINFVYICNIHINSTKFPYEKPKSVNSDLADSLPLDKLLNFMNFFLYILL